LINQGEEMNLQDLCETHLKLLGFEKKIMIQDERYMRTYRVLRNILKFQYFIILLMIVYKFFNYGENNILGLFLWIVIFVSILVGNVLTIQLKNYRREQ
jgi:hypothetical protein